MTLKYKSDWDSSKKRFAAFWNHEIEDRPMALVYATKRPDLPRNWMRILTEECWNDMPREWADMQTFFDGVAFLGDAYPMWFPNLGPGALTSFLNVGGKIEFSQEQYTSWQHPTVDLLSNAPAFELDRQNPYYQAVSNTTSQLAGWSRGNFIAGITDLGMGMDSMACLRGSEALCLDLLDDPERIGVRLSEIRRIWCQVYNELYALLPVENGSCSWLAAWAPGKTYPLQNDFSCMISPADFESFFLEDLREYCRFLDYPAYHLDGPAATRHLDALLSIPELKLIQWTPGAGAPGMGHWIPMLKRIQDAGKSIFVYVSEDEVNPIIENLRPEGVLMNLWVDSVEHGHDLMKKISRWNT